MKKKECPSCAMEVDEKSIICPVCSYEFPQVNMTYRIVAIVLIILMLIYFIL